MDPFGGLRIHRLQLPPYGQVPFVLRLAAQPLPQDGVSAGFLLVLDMVHDGLDIQARPTAQHRHPAPPQDIVDLLSCQYRVLGHRKGLLRRPEPDQMMRHLRHLLRSGLCRRNIHSPVDLHTVGGNDLAAQFLCQGNGQRRLAGSRRAYYGDQRIRFWRHRYHLVFC